MTQKEARAVRAFIKAADQLRQAEQDADNIGRGLPFDNPMAVKARNAASDAAADYEVTKGQLQRLAEGRPA